MPHKKDKKLRRLKLSLKVKRFAKERNKKDKKLRRLKLSLKVKRFAKERNK